MGVGSRSRVLGAVILVALGAAALPNSARATTTRAYTLGAMNRFVIDDTNRWLYPHMITKFKSLFYIELFGSNPSRLFSAPGSNRQATGPAGQTLDLVDLVQVQSTAGGGAILGLTDDIFIAAHLSDYEDPTVPAFLNLLAASSQGDPSAFPWLATVPPDSPGSANRKFDLFGAYNLQDLLQIGLHFEFGSSKYIRNPNDNDPEVDAGGGGTERRMIDEIKTTSWGLLLSAGLTPSEAFALDAGIGFRLHDLTYFPNDRELIEGGGGFELQFDARALIGLTEWWELVPVASVRFIRLSAADLASFATGLTYNNDVGRESVFITDVRFQAFVLDVGIAGHFKPTDWISFWAAVGIQWLNQYEEYENLIDEVPDAGLIRDQPLEFARNSVSADALPYIRLALEARVFSWLDFRGGVVKFIRADQVTEDNLDTNVPENNRLNDVVRDQPFFDYFLGFAAHYEGFFLDMQLDPFWFLRGPEALSGASGSGAGNMFINASLGYNF
jgi:hypothetical protein